MNTNIKKNVPISKLSVGDLISSDGETFHKIETIYPPTEKRATWILYGAWGFDHDEFGKNAVAAYAVCSKHV